MRSEVPDIAKTAARLLASVEVAWSRCANRHKGGVGKELKDDARAVSRAVLRAWRCREQQLRLVRVLCITIDDLKITVQLAKDVQAFASFAEFEAIARLVESIGRQSGGWLKSLQPVSQNAQAGTPVQRAPILSSRAASPSEATS